MQCVPPKLWYLPAASGVTSQETTNNLDTSGLGMGTNCGPHEHCNEPRISIKGGEFLGQSLPVSKVSLVKVPASCFSVSAVVIPVTMAFPYPLLVVY